MCRHRHRRSGPLAAVVLALPLLALSAGPAGAAPPATCAGLPATIVGTDGYDEITGTEGPDVISAGNGDDIVEALGGNDVVCGGDGEDRILGGEGDDEIRGDDGGDDLAGGPGDDVLRGGSDAFGASDLVSFDGAGAAVVVDLAERSSIGETEGTDTLIGIEGARGSAHPDQLLGSRLGDLLVAVGEGDELRGRGGDDTLVASAGTVRGNGGDDVAEISGTARAHLGAGDDRVESGSGTGTAELGEGDDHAAIHGGSFTVVGGKGEDTFRLWWEDFLDEEPALEDPILVGGPGPDRLLWDTPWSVIVEVDDGELSSSYGTARFDSISWFRGGEVGDRFYGTSGAQTFVGGPGDDLLKGLGGDDVLRGGRGDDQAFGGPGRDACTAEHEHSCER